MKVFDTSISCLR